MTVTNRRNDSLFKLNVENSFDVVHLIYRRRCLQHFDFLTR